MEIKTLLKSVLGVSVRVTGVMFDAVPCWASVDESYLGEKREGLERSPKYCTKQGS